MGALNNLAVHRRRFLRREGRLQHRARSAQLCPGLWKDGPVASRDVCSPIGRQLSLESGENGTIL
jgi:hypothetical protein